MTYIAVLVLAATVYAAILFVQHSRAVNATRESEELKRSAYESWIASKYQPSYMTQQELDALARERWSD